MASILLEIWRICNSQCKGHYLKNKNLFLKCLFDWWNLHEMLNILKKNLTAIAIVFPKLQTVKNFVRPLCKKRFGARFDSQHVKLSQLRVKSPSEHFHHVFSSLWGTVIWNMSPLVWGKILGVFVNTKTPNCKYPVEDYENLKFPMQMRLSHKCKTFSQLFVPFRESTSHLKHFEKKYDGHS